MKNYKIYSLKDPETFEIRYIGVTQRALVTRLYHHVYESKNSTGTYKKHWINSLLKKNLLPIIDIVETCTEQNWQEREKYWIKYYSNLTNTKEGGCGLFIKREQSSIERSANAHKKQICQLDYQGNIIKYWDSATDAAKTLNIKRSGIYKALSRKINSCFGFCWCYAKEVETFVPKIIIGENKQRKFPNSCKIRIITSDNKEFIFNSILQATKHFNVCFSYFNRSLKDGKIRNSKFILIERL